ncbi:MAG: YraN family protein [Candidatus Acidiferrales bacterium]
MFAAVNFAARNGLAEASSENDSPKQRARRTGIRGETFAYWYLRRHGYTLVARNFTSPGIKGEIDMVGYDGPVLAFVEVKTRSANDPSLPKPEEAVNWEKRRNLSRMARQFLRARRIEESACRFDILAIETRSGARPVVRLHKGAFGMGGE